ncbi:MAG: hypothetical protein ACHBNF_18485 [Chromatiales bacterium]
MRNALRLSPLVVLVLLGGCATLPNGPSVLVLPGTGKNFDDFRTDDAACRYYAYQQVGGVTSAEAASDSAVRSGAVGTALGAAAGAAIGGGRGAAVGAGTGLLLGGLTGAGAGERAGYALQQRYDFSYEQCMYAKGHRIPVSGPFTAAHEQRHYPPPPPPSPSAPKGAPTR